MADQDAAPLTDDERAELEALREEKARRDAEERARRERAELEALRAEQQQVDDEILAERRADEAVRAAARAAAPAGRQTPAAHATASGAAPAASPAPSEPRTFGQKMVMTPQTDDPDEIPGMPPAQKIIILVAILAVVAGGVYIALTGSAIG